MIEVRVEIKRRTVSVPVKNFVGLPPGGEANQVLVKRSSANYDFYWATPSSSGVVNNDPGDINLMFENQLI